MGVFHRRSHITGLPGCVMRTRLSSEEPLSIVLGPPERAVWRVERPERPERPLIPRGRCSHWRRSPLVFDTSLRSRTNRISDELVNTLQFPRGSTGPAAHKV
jgi:hypothetical protein